MYNSNDNNNNNNYINSLNLSLRSDKSKIHPFTQ
jgi:hypothetical protein